MASGRLAPAGHGGRRGAGGLVIGAISLRTRGVYFIMITLAFAQMLYYLANSIKAYGGDDGLTVRVRSSSLAGFGARPAGRHDALLRGAGRAGLALLVALARFVPSRFGRAVLALRDDEVRAEALGFPTYRYKLVVFVVGRRARPAWPARCSVNQQGYVSPNVLHWTQSGTLMVMVILGGVGQLWGGAGSAPRRCCCWRRCCRPTPALAVLDRLGAAGGGAVRAPRAGRAAGARSRSEAT